MKNLFIKSAKLSILTPPLLLIPMFAHADNEAWVEYQKSTKTLTFRYDDKKESTDATGKYSIPASTQNTPMWSNPYSGVGDSVKTVVFDRSFADARPTCCYAWFVNMENLTTIDGIENLNTSQVKSMDEMFEGCSSLTSIDLSHFDTGNVESMYRMFCECTALTSLKLSSFKTDSVTNMAYMFADCSKLTSITLPTFANTKLTSTACMFWGCSSLQTIDLSKFKTPSLKEMYGMFTNCSSLTSIDLSSFDTSHCTSMPYLFAGCIKLIEANLTSFNTSAVTNTTCMFLNCSSLESIYVNSNFELQKTCNGDNMFAGCKKLPGYDANNTDISKANYYSKGYLTMIESNAEAWVAYDDYEQSLTFHYDTNKTGTEDYDWYEILDDANTKPGWLTYKDKIKSVVIKREFAYARPLSCAQWFDGMDNLYSIEGLEYLNTSKVRDMTCMFDGCNKLTTLDLRHFNTENVTSTYGMFQGCNSLSKIYVSKSFVLPESCNGALMFNGCRKLTNYDENNLGKEMANYNTGYFSKYITTVEPWVAYNDATLTFYYNGERDYSDATMTCLYNIADDDSNFTTPGWYDYASKITKVVFDKSFADYRPTSCMGLCYQMYNLESIEGIENLNTSEVVAMQAMFSDCGLSTIDLSSLDVSSVTNMARMFGDCENLQTVDMSTWNTSKVENMSSMFDACPNLTSVDLSHFDMSANKTMRNMFSECTSLKSVKLPKSNVSNVTNMAMMFNGCKQIENIDLSYITFDKVTATYQMFSECSALKHIYINDKFALPSGCEANYMFRSCTSLPNYDPDNVDATKANYTDGYLTLRRHFSVGDATYNADGTVAVCYDDVAFDDKDAFTSEFDFTFASKNNATYKRAISSNWATLCLPFSFDTSAYEDMHCYKISEIGADKITVEKIDGTVAAGEPILVYTTIGKIYITGDDGSKVVKDPVASDYLTGTFAEAEVANDAKNYIISKDKFWNVASLISQSGATSVKMSPYRAYIAGQASNAKAVSLDIMMDETDGISNINANDTLQSLDGAEFYDAQGQRLSSPERGLVIIKNGGIARKMIVK